MRRIVALCERHDIDVRVTHTPGLKLDRPDQTASRGDPVEEPRQRYSHAIFAAVERGSVHIFRGGGEDLSPHGK